MKLLLLICLLATVAVAQEPFLSCIYYTFGPTDYNCQLIINNPNGLNNFTGIDGIHLEGFTNDDVDTVYIGNGFTTNIPQIICETFPNLYEIDFFNAGLTGIDDTAFSGCLQIGRLFLSYNRISSISENAFTNNRNVSYIHLGDNLLTELAENLFENQQNLTDLILSYNFFTDIPAGLFRPLENLRNLYLGSINLTTINNQWFTGNSQLTYLYLGHNRITLSPNMFSGIDGLRAISLAFNELSEIPTGTFAGLPSLQTLDLYWNNFTALPADSFPGIDQLVNIDLSRNPIETIDANAFRGIESLQSLALESCSIRDLSSISLNLPNLTYVDFNFNSIEEIPSGFFESTPRLSYIGFWANSLKTLRRNSFGSLNALTTLDLDGNIVNAIDRSFIDDAVNLITFYFDDNLCASSYFGNFVANRARYLPMLERCFRNMRYIVEATTENDGVYSFFEGIQPGIVLRVRSDNEVQIALTPFDFIWTPAIEIFIGSSNNTRSVIRVNDDTNVVTVPTPNIIRQNQWNDFRISWANQNVLVYNSNDTFPFMSYTMQQFFPVNFYGLRAVEARATWSVQPIFVEDD